MNFGASLTEKTRIKLEWNIATLDVHAVRYLTSADRAKIRLHGVVAQDRKACGDGKWVKVRDKQVCMIPWACYISQNPVVQELIRAWERHDKLTYRWTVRR
jgi:hypothetical protein